MSDYKTQIVVIAGGPSGLSAAVQAAEDGAEVIVVEKAAAIGGAANMGMGPLGIGTRYQKQQMEDITVEKAFNMFMEYTHYNVDARLVKRYFEQSAETIEWLEDMGVEFEGHTVISKIRAYMAYCKDRSGNWTKSCLFYE